MSSPPPLGHGRYYHIYNRGNNREDLFREKRNYPYFLKLYSHHIEPVAETFAYCLMKNHFHLLLRIKELPDTQKDPKGRTLRENPSGLKFRDPSQSFSNLFNAYTKAINKAHNRTGGLFEHPFGRIEVTKDIYFKRLVTYIHQNPQKHSFAKDFRDWPYSSYSAMLSSNSTKVKRDEVLEWFSTRDRFVKEHQDSMSRKEIGDVVAEDFE